MDMAPKMGRPTDNPKTFQVVVKLDEDSQQILLDFCEKRHVSRSEAVRIAIAKLMEELQKDGE